jgi:Tfp pilus assembly protein PilO
MAEEISITDWLQKAKEDPKVAAQPVVIVLAILFGGYKALYAPNIKTIEKQLKKNKKIVKQIKSVESAVDNIEDIKLEIEEAQAKWKKTKALCYKNTEVTKFLRRVRKLGKISGIKMRNPTPQPKEPITIGEITLEKFPVSFYFSGDLLTLARFLRNVEKEEKLTFLSLPALTPNASGTFEMELSPTAVFLPADLSKPETNEDEDE